MFGPVALQSAGNENLSVTVLMFVRAFFREDRPLIGDAHLRSVCMYLRIRNSSAQFKASCGEVAVLEMVIFSLVASLSPWAGIDAHAWSMRHVGSHAFPNPGVSIMFAAQIQLWSRIPEKILCSTIREWSRRERALGLSPHRSGFDRSWCTWHLHVGSHADAHA